MQPKQFWKNFRLGEELSVSGAFIYNGLRRFHEIQKLDHVDELFEVFYYLSVGFERLLKITVVMLEHDETVDQEAFEATLITHSHLELLRRIRGRTNISLGKSHNDFLSLLSTFYKQRRYGRFTLSSVWDFDREQRDLCRFLAKYLKVSFPDDKSLIGIFNDARFRKFMRSTAIKISSTLYEIVKARARELNLYTYELRHDSKAQMVFLGEADIPAEDVLWKELLVFFMNTKEATGYLSFLRSISPLDFDPADVEDLLDCFKSTSTNSMVMDQLEHHYEEMEKSARAERLKLMEAIGSHSLSFPEDEECEDEDFEPLDDPDK